MLTRPGPRPAVAWTGVRRLTLNRITLLMGLLGLLFIVVTTALAAWNERRTLFKESREHAEQSAFFLADHAARLFEVTDLALRAAGDAAPGDGGAPGPELAASLRSTAAMLPYVDTVWIADATGRVRLTTLDHPPSDYSVADRDVFKEAASPGDRLIIGNPITGRLTGRPTFLVARRLGTPDGPFRGAVGASMDLSYFTSYWRRLDAPNGERVILMRGESGDVLVRYPPPQAADSNDRLGAGLLDAVRAAPEAGAFAPKPHRFAAYHRIGALPLYVAVVFQDAAVEAQWANWLWHVLPFAGVPFAVLLALMLAGRRLASRENRARTEVEAARRLLAAANSDLERRVTERTAHLRDSNREIQRFASVVGHDLRAPLVNIMGFTAELQALRGDLFEAPAPPSAAVRDDFDEAISFIRSSIERMDRLINAVLALSRQGARTFAPEPLDMEGLMRGLADEVARRAQVAGATLTVDPLPPVTADRVAVEQVFANLLDNAVKYLRPGVPGTVRVGGHATAAAVTYTVRDNGRGIGPADRERVFDLFRRAGALDQPGEGIGLATVRALVRRLGGAVALDSEPGRGSTFTVTLPRSCADADALA